MFNRNDEKTEEPGFSGLASRVSDHLETRFEYTRLVIFEKFSLAFVKAVSRGIALRLFLFGYFFLNIAAGIWIGMHYNNYALGFGIIAGCYFILVLIYLALRGPLEKRMLDATVTTLCNEPENDDDEDE